MYLYVKLNWDANHSENNLWKDIYEGGVRGLEESYNGLKPGVGNRPLLPMRTWAR